ncbi:hypothetical protein MIMGU_mgv1a022768mg, partial [Erythranthe guttata]
NFEYNDELTYSPIMAPISPNQSSFENGGIEALYRRGEFPPLVVAFNSLEGYTVEADGSIKDMTLIAEYAGDVDYIRNREEDDCYSRMTLLSSADPSKSLAACADRLGNISRVLSVINNHTTKGRKKQKFKCVRYTVDKECVVFLVANREKNQSSYPRYWEPAAAGGCRRIKEATMTEIMRVAKQVDLAPENDGGGDYYSKLRCEECGSGEREDELLLCNM